MVSLSCWPTGTRWENFTYTADRQDFWDFECTSAYTRAHLIFVACCLWSASVFQSPSLRLIHWLKTRLFPLPRVGGKRRSAYSRLSNANHQHHLSEKQIWVHCSCSGVSSDLGLGLSWQLSFIGITSIEAEEAVASTVIPITTRLHMPELSSFFVIDTTMVWDWESSASSQATHPSYAPEFVSRNSLKITVTTQFNSLQRGHGFIIRL